MNRKGDPDVDRMDGGSGELDAQEIDGDYDEPETIRMTFQQQPDNAVTPDEPDAFETWWQKHPHKNRELANYTVKKQIAWDAWYARATVAMQSSQPITEDAVERQAMPTDEGLIKALEEWALNKSSVHHRLAVENKSLRTEHIASSSAYRSLAEAIEALSRHKAPLSGDDVRSQYSKVSKPL